MMVLPLLGWAKRIKLEMAEVSFRGFVTCLIIRPRQPSACLGVYLHIGGGGEGRHHGSKKINADFTGRKRFLIYLEVFYNPLEGKKNGTIQRLITRSLLYA
jgi:hypothetical protein